MNVVEADERALDYPNPQDSWIAGRDRRAARLVRKWLVYPRTRCRLSMEATRE
jgi:hypothetical protein